MVFSCLVVPAGHVLVRLECAGACALHGADCRDGFRGVWDDELNLLFVIGLH